MLFCAGFSANCAARAGSSSPSTQRRKAGAPPSTLPSAKGLPPCRVGAGQGVKSISQLASGLTNSRLGESAPSCGSSSEAEPQQHSDSAKGPVPSGTQRAQRRPAMV